MICLYFEWSGNIKFASFFLKLQITDESRRMKLPNILWFIIGVHLMSACSKGGMNNLENIQSDIDVGSETATDVEIYYTDSLSVSAIVYASSMIKFNTGQKKKIFPKGVRVLTFDHQQREASYIQSNFAEQLNNDDEIFLKDSVYIENNVGEKLYADELIWSKKNNTITSDKKVRIVTSENEIRGFGLISNLSFSEWELDSVSGLVESNNIVQ